MLLFCCTATATTEIYTLSLHDALPIWRRRLTLTKEAKSEIFSKHGIHETDTGSTQVQVAMLTKRINDLTEDRKSTRLNSSHPSISYAVFCLKKKNIKTIKLHITLPQY